jgi:hypothetical protein
MKNRGRLAKQATLLVGILAGVFLSAPISMRAATATTVTPSTQPTARVSRVQVQLIFDVVETNQKDLAGLGIDPDHATATVYVVTARQGLSSTVVTMSAILAEASKPAPDGAKNWTLAFALTTHSLAELRQARDAVTVREPWATASRPYLAEWYVDAISNRVVLGVTEISSTLTAAAQQTFGDMARLIVAARIAPADRNTDYSPWTAGDAINVVGNGCTSGFSAYDTVTLAHGELGAGHCSSAQWDPVQQGTAPMGHVGYRVFGSGNLDFAFFNSTADGSDSTPSAFTTVSALTPVSSSLTSGGLFGYPVCASGSVTLENCATTVRLEDVCITYTTGQQVCHLDMAESTNGSSVVNHGDSGGPVYHKNPGGDVQAVGVINACTAVSQTDPRCITPSTQVWFTPIRFIPSRFQVMTTSSPIPPAPTRATIRSNANGLFTSTEVSYGGGDYALLRARAASVGGWEQYTLIPQPDGTYAIQSSANGLFVTAELGNPGSTYAELRARSNAIGSWEKFRLILQSGNTYAIQSDANGQYVAGEFGNPEPYYAMLRARSSAIGGWEQWTINST